MPDCHTALLRTVRDVAEGMQVRNAPSLLDIDDAMPSAAAPVEAFDTMGSRLRLAQHLRFVRPHLHDVPESVNRSDLGDQFKILDRSTQDARRDGGPGTNDISGLTP